MSKFLELNFVFGIIVFFIKSSRVLSYDIIDQNQVLLELLSPQENPSIHVQALRRELLKKVQEALEKLDDEKDYQKAREALARWNSLPEQKRNLQSLAKNGYIRTIPDEEPDQYKRSLAKMTINEQLTQQLEEQKRGLESLARNGDLRYRKEQELNNFSNKRHISSLARNFELPQSGKRSLSSLAKSGDLYKHSQYKRNAETSIPNTGSKQSSNNPIGYKEPLSENKKISDDSKRSKRQVDYYYDNGNENYLPVYQNAYDYDDLMQDVHDADPDVSKRFLGSVAKSGWFRPSSSSSSSMSSKYLNPDKRHIGSLARLGWLPSFRHIRRFNRSGRSASEINTCRETSPDGETEVDGHSDDASVLLRPLRRLHRLPEENGFIRRVFYHPLTTKY
ncbi:neuropeptide-like precursor 1 isoform X1 [Diorhabda carinulata]|uniref:neuropeptide-like precursor 1 isoform X1 n=1 Tax=Diorhabda carinulata TaxID=1163345 RepID=UPI0025A0D3EE|nr:neuropeptide-like precursor 1 isoform X1 [Diorhabda carinulata]